MLKFQNFNGEHSKRTCIFPIINILSLKSTFKPFNIKYRYRGTETIVGNIKRGAIYLLRPFKHLLHAYSGSTIYSLVLNIKYSVLYNIESELVCIWWSLIALSSFVSMFKLSSTVFRLILLDIVLKFVSCKPPSTIWGLNDLLLRWRQQQLTHGRK